MADYVEEGNSESRADILQDLLIGHQVGILRVANGITRDVVRRMNESEDAFIARILTALNTLGIITAANYISQQPKVERVIRDLSRERMQSWDDSNELINKEMIALALWEVQWQEETLVKVLKDSRLPAFRAISFTEAAAKRLVQRTPIRGRTLGDWSTLLAENDTRQVAQEIRDGLRNSLAPAEIVDRIRGTAASGFEDGISARLRDKVDGVVKTTTVEVTQSVREKVWKKYRKHISGLVWSAVLDSLTSALCRGLDGRVAPLFGMEDTLDPGLPRLEPPTLRPPAHFRCRSIMAAIVDGILPRQTSYEQWLTKQPADVQKDILGPRRFRLLETGTLDFSRLFDGPTGRPLTLADLKVREGFE
jgi:hypothetical protein